MNSLVEVIALPRWVGRSLVAISFAATIVAGTPSPFDSAEPDRTPFLYGVLQPSYLNVESMRSDWIENFARYLSYAPVPRPSFEEVRAGFRLLMAGMTHEEMQRIWPFARLKVYFISGSMGHMREVYTIDGKHSLSVTWARDKYSGNDHVLVNAELFSGSEVVEEITPRK